MSDAHQQQRYRVIERLASGGMAEVFLAESAGIEGFKKLVAIKRVLPHLSEKKRFIAMFLDEARLSAHLSHSNVAQVFDIGVGDNAYFIVMEYVDGSDLKAVIEYVQRNGRTIPIEAACFIAAKICEGLTYAHELSGRDGHPLHIVHRDMSPPNVLITKHGEIKIVDFGLAKATSQLEKSEAGIIKGKFGYLSPEAALGQEVDLRTDIFAVGIILWELLSGKRLFVGETDFATVKMVQAAHVASPRAFNPAVPQELEAILARALARDPAARYASARDLGRDLTAFLYRFGRPVSAYDIAELVRGAVAHRKKQSPDKASIIEKLIDEALLEFTSLQDDKGAPAPARPNEASALSGFEDIGKWADEINGGAPISLEGRDLVRNSLPKGAFEEGNLAALEDDEPMPSAGSAPSPTAPREGMVVLSDDALPAAPAPGPADALAAPRRSNAALGAVAVAVLLALGVGAWMAGLFGK
ncbi:MAG: serine/threonine-protein kinase [Byssovorax sp.]